MKRIKILLMLLVFAVVGFAGIDKVYAASATINARASKSTVVIGDSVTVTVTVSSAVAIGAWEFVVNYDTSRLTLTSTTNATYIADVAPNGSTKSKSYSYTFKAKKTGSASVTLASYSVLGWDDSTLATTASNAYMTVVEPVVVVLSGNANLEALTVSKGTLSPAFAVDTLEYSVSITELIDKITITPTKDDEKANIVGGGELAVSEGANAFDIKVTAENGTIKTYKVNVNMIDSNPIKVVLNKANYTVVKNKGTLVVPSNYKETTIPISGINVVAYENTTTKLLLVGLKDDKGVSGLYVYTANGETYTAYNEIKLGSINLYIYDAPKDVKMPKGYVKSTFKVNEISVNGYKIEKSKSDFYLVYGMNVDTGEKGFYSYDNKELTFQRFNTEGIDSLQTVLNNYIIILIVCGALVLVLIGLNVLQLSRYSKLTGKISRAKERANEINKRTS